MGTRGSVMSCYWHRRIRLFILLRVVYATHPNTHTDSWSYSTPRAAAKPPTAPPPFRCLALEALARLALMPEVLAGVKHHMPTVSAALKDPDVSIRKKAMDLLFTMCDASNASSLVGELLTYLVSVNVWRRGGMLVACRGWGAGCSSCLSAGCAVGLRNPGQGNDLIRPSLSASGHGGLCDARGARPQDRHPGREVRPQRPMVSPFHSLCFSSLHLMRLCPASHPPTLIHTGTSTLPYSCWSAQGTL